jgi:hypothetical protein
MGFIVYVRGTDVVISTPQILTETTAGRIRRVAYGRDLANLDIDRKLGKETVPQIEVVSYDPKNRRAVSGKFPADKDVKKVTTGIGTKKNETQIFTVDGITDPGQLDKIAELRYNNLARAEATIRFSTKDLKDLDGNDLLFLRPGDPVQLGFDSIFDEDFKEQSEAERAERMLDLGYTEEVAQVVAQEYDRWVQAQNAFYTKDVAFDWSQDGGLNIDVTALNFVSPARDKVDAISGGG